MNGISRYSPFSSELARFDPLWDIDDMFNRFMMRPFPLSSEEMGLEPQIRMDVKESDEKYLINAEIPGVNKDDIHVTIDGKRASISAEVKQEKEVKEGEWMIRSERSYGTALRSFTLADEIDQNKILAKYNNGILKHTLPKKLGVARKEIFIS